MNLKCFFKFKRTTLNTSLQSCFPYDDDFNSSESSTQIQQAKLNFKLNFNLNP